MELRHLGSLALPAMVALLLSAWAIAGLRLRQGKTAGWSAIVLAGIAPPLLVTWVILAAVPRFGDLRVALEGVRFRLESLGQGQRFQVRVGGSPEQDHLVVRDLPPGFLTFQFDGSRVHADLASDTAEAVDDEEQTEAHKPFAVVRVGGVHPFHNAVSMNEPAWVVVGGTTFAFDPKRPAFGATLPEIPHRTTDVLNFEIPVFRELRAEQATYPLRYYGSPDPDQELLGPEGKPLGSFVARDGQFLRRHLYLVLTEESVRVERDGQGPIGFQRRAATIEDGKSSTFALFRVDYVKPWLDRAARAIAAQRGEDEEEPPPSRVQERRSFTARLDKGVLDLLFDTPTYVQLGTPELDSLKRRAKRAEVPALLRLVGRRFIFTAGEGQMLLEFPVLGDPLSTELFSRVELPEGDDEIRVTTHTGSRAYKLGDSFEIGDAAAAIVRVTRLELPWGALLLVWAVVAVAVVTGRSHRERLIPLVLLSGVELLLALRVLIAYQGAYVDPEAASAAWQSLGALVAVPFILQATLAFYEGRWKSWETWTHAGVTVAALATILLHSHAGVGDWGAALGTVLGIPVLLGLTMRLPKIWRLPKTIPGLLPWLDRFDLDARVDPTRPFRPLGWLVLLFLLLLFRITTLSVVGWKERMDLGVGPVLAVSIYYTPLALWLFARLWAWRSDRRAIPILGGLLVLLYPLPSALARDLGALLIFPIPVIMLFTLPLVEKRNWRNACLALPAVVPLFVFLALPFFPALGLSPKLAGWTAADVEKARSDRGAAEDLLASRIRVSQNHLRAWNLVAPTELRQVGTQTAESQVIVMANLRDYAGRGPFGGGYLSVPLSEALRATHLDDNLSAVHVLASFGWVGGLALLVFLSAWAVAPVLALQGSGSGGSLISWITPRIAFGLVLVWTIAVAGLYMFSANVELLLFTGKNIYLLAAASRSDLVEGTLLVLLALWALAFRSGGRPLP